MSSLFHNYILKTMLRYSEKAPSEVSLSIVTSIIATNGIYAYGTKRENQFIVKSKYTYCKNGHTDFMVIDENGKHYNVMNSFWYWKWDSIEDWNRIEPGKPVAVSYFGWRVPFFGMFPNIIRSEYGRFGNDSVPMVHSSPCNTA